MELAVGSIVTGKVTTITKFGAFIALPGGKSGLVHISEVAPTFVNDVHDFLAEGQEVSVKILAITPEGKINLSVKQALPKPERPERPTRRESAPRRAAQPAPVPAGRRRSRLSRISSSSLCPCRTASNPSSTAIWPASAAEAAAGSE